MALDGFRLIARINRVGCNNGLARCAHDRLVAKLGELIELTLLVVEAQRCSRDGGARAEQAAEDLYWIEAEFEHRWIGQPQPLLDHLDVDLATQEIFDPRTKRWYALECGPSLREVSDQNLCGLRQIIDQIACETGVSFHAHRIVYGSTELVPSGR